MVFWSFKGLKSLESSTVNIIYKSWRNPLKNIKSNELYEKKFEVPWFLNWIKVCTYKGGWLTFLICICELINLMCGIDLCSKFKLSCPFRDNLANFIWYNLWVSSKTAKNPFFFIFGLEKLFFPKIIWFVCFRARFRSESKLEKIFWTDKNLKVSPKEDFSRKSLFYLISFTRICIEFWKYTFWI